MAPWRLVVFHSLKSSWWEICSATVMTSTRVYKESRKDRVHLVVVFVEHHRMRFVEKKVATR